jgi:hypothetical protein
MHVWLKHLPVLAAAMLCLAPLLVLGQRIALVDRLQARTRPDRWCQCQDNFGATPWVSRDQVKYSLGTRAAQTPMRLEIYHKDWVKDQLQAYGCLPQDPDAPMPHVYHGYIAPGNNEQLSNIRSVFILQENAVQFCGCMRHPSSFGKKEVSMDFVQCSKQVWKCKEDAHCQVTGHPHLRHTCNVESGFCEPKGDGLACRGNVECATGKCSQGRCVRKELYELCRDAEHCETSRCFFGLCALRPPAAPFIGDLAEAADKKGMCISGRLVDRRPGQPRQCATSKLGEPCYRSSDCSQVPPNLKCLNKTPVDPDRTNGLRVGLCGVPKPVAGSNQRPQIRRP